MSYRIKICQSMLHCVNKKVVNNDVGKKLHLLVSLEYRFEDSLIYIIYCDTYLRMFSSKSEMSRIKLQNWMRFFEDSSHFYWYSSVVLMAHMVILALIWNKEWLWYLFDTCRYLPRIQVESALSLLSLLILSYLIT